MPIDMAADNFSVVPQTKFSGISRRIDTRAIVDAQIDYAKAQSRALTQQQELLTSRQAAYNGIATALQKLKNDANQVKQQQQLLPATASVTDPTILGAAAGTGAVPGTYSILVNALATAQSNLSGDYASARRPGLLSTGTLSIQVGTAAPEVYNIDQNTTLLGLANTIDSNSQDLVATVVDDGTSYRLNVRAINTGQVNSLTFTDHGSGLDFATQSTEAQDASVRINGAPAIVNANNTFSDAIPGVTLKTQSVSATPQTLTVSLDTSRLAVAVVDLVTDYNDVQTAINGVSAFSGRYDPKNLMGDITLHQLQGALQNALRPAATAAGSWVAPSQLGVATQADGTLRLDMHALQSAISLDPQSVAAMLGNSGDNIALGVAGQLAQAADAYSAPFTGILSQVNAAMLAEYNRTQNILQDRQYAVGALQDTLKEQFVALLRQMVSLRAQDAIIAAYAEQIDAVEDHPRLPEQDYVDPPADPAAVPTPAL